MVLTYLHFRILKFPLNMDPSWVRMIDYNEDWLFSTIFRLDGSVALRSTLFAFPAAMLLGSGITG